MLRSVEFTNFKALRHARLPLGPFTLILGPNGSGKSTALQAIQEAAAGRGLLFSDVASVGIGPAASESVEVIFDWADPYPDIKTIVRWSSDNRIERQHLGPEGVPPTAELGRQLDRQLGRFRTFGFNTAAIAQPVTIQRDIELASDGTGFAAVLERLRDEDYGRLKAYNQEVGRWLPEYDEVLFDTPANGMKEIALRTRKGHHRIPAAQLSQGTLLSLAILSLVYLPNPPVFVGLEEPDHGLHPRLLRELRDALYRLSYPESCGETRPPVQVVVTTHSPYLLDLYRDHPEEVVLAQKTGLDVQFERLADKADVDEILGDAPLSEVWYSGILGGVPVPS